MQLQEKPRDTIANSGESVSASSDGKLHTHGLYRLGFNYGRFIHRFRVLVIILWAVGLAISVPFALQLTSKLTGGGYSMSSSESVQVGNVMVDRLHAPPSTLLVAFHSDSVAVTDPSYQRRSMPSPNSSATIPMSQALPPLVLARMGIPPIWRSISTRLPTTSRPRFQLS